MTDFNDLESLYKHLEDQALTDRHFHQARDLFVKFRDANQETNPGESEKAQWEIYFLWFVLKEGELLPQWQETDEHGEVREYPDLNQFNEKTYEYLTERLNATDHPKLKAQYAHILWCSPKKHNRFAEIAVDSYLKLVSIYEQRYDKGENFAQEISEGVTNAYAIARQINDDVEKIKVELKRLVQKFSPGAPFSTSYLIQFMLKSRQGFTQEDFDGLEDLCWQMAESFVDDGHRAIKFLELGKEVAQKLGKQPDKWIQRIAQHYEALMQLFDEGLVALGFCMDAIENYKEIGDEEKVKELERRYSELKDSMKFGRSRVEVDLTKIVKVSKEWAKEVVKNKTSEDIIRGLICDKDLLPTYDEVEKAVKERIKESPTYYLLSKVVLDQNGNTVQHFDSEEEKEHYDILEEYKSQLEFGKIYLIRELFFEAILENKLTFEGLMDFINKHCWYGKNLSAQSPDNQAVTYNWLSLIAPALYEYFRQMDFYFADRTSYVPAFVLSLDSLTLKIEGLFRDLCQLRGVGTTYQREDNSGRNIAHEKDVNALLHEDAIKELFDKDDLLFFKFLLVEQCGYNLRNKIAHALMLFPEYSGDYMHLVILALLRLGKYDFTQNNDESSDESCTVKK